ncbi:MAG TPA: ABC transporter substrate-binding protein [Nevskiaceae bacterium]
MKKKQRGDSLKGVPASMSRRRVLVGGASMIAGTALGLRSPRIFAAAEDEEIRVGWITALSGKLAGLTKQDPYIMQLAEKAVASGISVGGKKYRIRFLQEDSQSSPSRASQLASDLITKEHVHLILVQPTPDVVNPVSDACEAASVPSLGTSDPLESFFFGRGGKIGQPGPFKWTFDFFPDAKLWVNSYLSTWSKLQTNKKVGVLYPNDADGMAFRHAFPPIMEKHGYKVIDPGPYQDGTTDYTTQIALFNKENCQIFNTVGIPDDVNTFWRQAAQLHYAQKVLIAQFAKAGQVPSQVTVLGPLGFGLTTAIFWTPVFPYKSPLTGMTSRQLADDYENRFHELWNGQVGPSMALAELGVAALKAAKDPTSHGAIRDAIANLDLVTTVGRVDFRNGPYPGTATSPIIGVQWVKPKAGSKFPLDCVTIEHANDTAVPIQRKLVAYNQGL